MKTLWTLLLIFGLAAGMQALPVSAKTAGDKIDGETPPEAPAKPTAIHTFEMIEGRWVGQVTEAGVDASYRIEMTMRANGAGEVHYLGARYDCKGVLAPRSAGRELVFVETIVLARDQCADGEVHVTLSGDRMEWRWVNEYREVQATATLTRQK